MCFFFLCSYLRDFCCQPESVASSCSVGLVSDQPGCSSVHRPDPSARHSGRHEPPPDALWNQQRLHASAARRPLPHALPLHTLLQVHTPPHLWDMSCMINCQRKEKLLSHNSYPDFVIEIKASATLFSLMIILNVPNEMLERWHIKVDLPQSSSIKKLKLWQYKSKTYK